MNPLIIAILILGGICFAFILWLYRQKTYYEGQIEKCEEAFNVLAKNSEIMIKSLTDKKEGK